MSNGDSFLFYLSCDIKLQVLLPLHHHLQDIDTLTVPLSD